MVKEGITCMLAIAFGTLTGWGFGYLLTTIYFDLLRKYKRSEDD